MGCSSSSHANIDKTSFKNSDINIDRFINYLNLERCSEKAIEELCPFSVNKNWVNLMIEDNIISTTFFPIEVNDYEDEKILGIRKKESIAQQNYEIDTSTPSGQLTAHLIDTLINVNIITKDNNLIINETCKKVPEKSSKYNTFDDIEELLKEEEVQRKSNGLYKNNLESKFCFLLMRIILLAETDNTDYGNKLLYYISKGNLRHIRATDTINRFVVRKGKLDLNTLTEKIGKDSAITGKKANAILNLLRECNSLNIDQPNKQLNISYQRVSEDRMSAISFETHPHSLCGPGKIYGDNMTSTAIPQFDVPVKNMLDNKCNESQREISLNKFSVASASGDQSSCKGDIDEEFLVSPIRLSDSYSRIDNNYLSLYVKNLRVEDANNTIFCFNSCKLRYLLQSLWTTWNKNINAIQRGENYFGRATEKKYCSDLFETQDLREKLNFILNILDHASLIKKLYVTKEKARELLKLRFTEMRSDISEAPCISKTIETGEAKYLYWDDESAFLKDVDGGITSISSINNTKNLENFLNIVAKLPQVSRNIFSEDSKKKINSSFGVSVDDISTTHGEVGEIIKNMPINPNIRNAFITTSQFPNPCQNVSPDAKNILRERLGLVGELESNEMQKVKQRVVEQRMNVMFEKEGLMPEENQNEPMDNRSHSSGSLFSNNDYVCHDSNQMDKHQSFFDTTPPLKPQPDDFPLPRRNLSGRTGIMYENQSLKDSFMSHRTALPKQDDQTCLFNTTRTTKNDQLSIQKTRFLELPKSNVSPPCSNEKNIKQVAMSNSRTFDLLQYLSPMIVIWPTLHLHYLLWFPWLFGINDWSKKNVSSDSDELKKKVLKRDKLTKIGDREIIDEARNINSDLADICRFMEPVKYCVKVFVKDLTLEDYFRVMKSNDVIDSIDVNSAIGTKENKKEEKTKNNYYGNNIGAYSSRITVPPTRRNVIAELAGESQSEIQTQSGNFKEQINLESGVPHTHLETKAEKCNDGNWSPKKGMIVTPWWRQFPDASTGVFIGNGTSKSDINVCSASVNLRAVRINNKKSRGLLFVSHQLACKNIVDPRYIRITPEIAVIWSVEIILDKNGKSIANDEAAIEELQKQNRGGLMFFPLDADSTQSVPENSGSKLLDPPQVSNSISNTLRFVGAKMTIHRIFIKNYDSYAHLPPTYIKQDKHSPSFGVSDTMEFQHKRFVHSYSLETIVKNSTSEFKTLWEARRQLIEERVFHAFGVVCEIVDDFNDYIY